MGQKVHPIGFRLGINKDWQSSWYAKKDYVSFLHEDIAIRKYLKKELYHAGVASISIERSSNRLKINILAARPGIIIGKRGAEVDRLKEDIQKRIPNTKLLLNIVEVRRPEINAQLIAENIALQIERRVAFRRAMKKTIQSATRFGVQGIRVNCAGRLAGNDIARAEWYREGRVPLHTIRADIDLGFAEAKTTYGIIGVKVWVFNGEIIPERVEAVAAVAE